MFSVTGGNGKSATVSCEVEKLRWMQGIVGKQFFFRSLAVDIPEDDDQFIVDGSIEHMVNKEEIQLR